MTDQTPIDLGALTDEEIATMSPREVERYLEAAFNEADGERSADDESGPQSNGEDSQSAAPSGDRDDQPAETGGTASGYDSLETVGEVAGAGSADPYGESGNEESYSEEGEDQGTTDYQSAEADLQPDSNDEASGDLNWKAEYEELKAQWDNLLGSFKASGRVVKVESPEDARRLMQMGYDYNLKMRDLKPRLRTLKTLEKADLLDDEKLNFAIDLMAGKPEAVAKFLKEREIDPLDLDLEDGANYRPADHMISEGQAALDEVLDSIRDTESFPRTAEIITKRWDKASQEVLMGIPQLIAVINDHVLKGYYDVINDKVQYERSLGRLAGLSDLDAYKAVGDALQAQGAFAPAGSTSSKTPKSGQVPSQDLQGSSGSNRSRKRAASPTQGNASTGKGSSKNFLSDYTDEEIEKMGSLPL